MHPTIKELLALQDGEAGAEVARHVTGCELCSRELEHLRTVVSDLCELPAVAPEHDGWQRLQLSIRRDRHRRRWRQGLAAAAALLISVGLASLLLLLHTSQKSAPETVRVEQPELSMEELMYASQHLETLLHSPTVRYRVLTPRQAAIIVDLEDRIALIDAELSLATTQVSTAPATAREARPVPIQLWLNRVELLHTMVEVHRLTPQRLADQPSSYRTINHQEPERR